MLAAFLLLSISTAYSIEYRLGLSANGLAGYANVEEKLKDSGRISNQEAVLPAAFASGFVEVGSDDMMGVSLGVSYAPEVAELNKETRNIQPSATGDSGTQEIQADIVDLIQIYLSMPIGDGAFVKAGYMMATMETNETLATGSSYEDVDMTGMVLAGGYQADLGDSMFWRAEGQYQM